MTTTELKTKVEKYRAGLKERSGKTLISSESGPVGMSLIDAIVATLEAQQAKIEELEAKIANQAS